MSDPSADVVVAEDFEDFCLLVQSRVPIIVLETHDENRALEMLTRLAVKQALPLFNWPATQGLQPLGFGAGMPGAEEDLADPELMLASIRKRREPGLYVLCDLHPWLKEPRVVRLLKDVALRYREEGHMVVLLSHRLEIPPELARLVARVEMSLPDEEEIMAIVREEARSWQEANNGRKVKTDSSTLAQLVRSLSGLTHADCRRLIRGAIFDDGCIADSDIPELNRARFELMNLDGVLSYEYRTAQFSDVAGMRNLRAWLDKRRDAVTATPGADGLDSPKGLLLLGVQGAGKGLTARGGWRLGYAATQARHGGALQQVHRRDRTQPARIAALG